MGFLAVYAAIFKQALDQEALLYLCVVNWGEVYYIALRESGGKAAELYCQTIEKYPIQIIDASKLLTLEAAKLKAHFPISYADAYAAALAKTHKAALVTGDREFKALEHQIKICWLY